MNVASLKTSTDSLVEIYMNKVIILKCTFKHNANMRAERETVVVTSLANVSLSKNMFLPSTCLLICNLSQIYSTLFPFFGVNPATYIRSTFQKLSCIYYLLLLSKNEILVSSD
jgi:hypothetical protein